jgi:hypothetical protein
MLMASETKRVFAEPRPPKGFATTVAALMIGGILATGSARGLGLDAIVEQSLLGQPLRVVIPVVAQSGEEPADLCPRIVPSSVDADNGLVSVGAARVALERTAESTRLVVTTSGPVNELAMRLTVRVGCERAVQREYVILFDLPPVEAAVSAGTAMSASAASAIEASSSHVRASIAAPATLTPPVVAALRPAARIGAEERASSARPIKGALPDMGSHARSSNVAAQPAPRRSPRLAISRTVQAAQVGEPRDATFRDLSKTAQISALQEQEIVLRKRVNELADQVARMHQERIAELTAQIERTRQDLRTAEAAERAAEAARKNKPWAIFLRWLDEFWPILAAVLGVAILATAVLAWRRHRMIQNAMLAALAPRLSGTINEPAYGDDSLVSRPHTGSRQAGAAARAANWDDQSHALPLIPAEEDFDDDIALRVAGDTKRARLNR